MEFVTVFDITTQPYGWHEAAGGLLSAVVLSFWSFLVWQADEPRKRLVPRVLAVFAVVWTAAIFWGTFSEWYYGRTALWTHTAGIVEGPIEHFVPMPFTGHADERFTVRGVAFSYSDYSMTSAFKNTSSHGGPIHAGLYVRVHYLGESILKLEVGRPRRP